MSNTGTTKRGRGRPRVRETPRTQYTVRVEASEDAVLTQLAQQAGYSTPHAYITAVAKQLASQGSAAPATPTSDGA